MKKFLSILAITATVILCISCATTEKIKAAKSLSKVTLNVHDVTLDSLKGNPDLFKQIGTATKSLLPNPQVVIIVQDLARNIINAQLGTAFLAVDLTGELPEGADTLYIRNIQGSLSLDSLYELPFTAADSSMLAPGKNQLHFYTRLPIDRRLFKIFDVAELNIKGSIAVSFDPPGTESSPVSFDFDVTRPVTEDEKKQLVESAREKLLHALVGDWVNSILPQE